MKLKPSLLTSVTCLAAVLLLVGGCRQKGTKLDATAEGTVTIDGELVPSGTVSFIPVKKGPIAVGRVFEDGSYSVRVGQGDLTDPDGGGLPSGDYVVTVLVSGPSEKDAVVAKGGPPLSGPRLSAQKYMDKSTTDLRFTLKPGRNVIVLKLDGVSSDPPPPEEEDAAAGEVEKSDEAKADSADARSEEKTEAPAEEKTEPRADGPVQESPADSASPATTEPSTSVDESPANAAGGESK